MWHVMCSACILRVLYRVEEGVDAEISGFYNRIERMTYDVFYRCSTRASEDSAGCTTGPSVSYVMCSTGVLRGGGRAAGRIQRVPPGQLYHT